MWCPQSCVKEAVNLQCKKADYLNEWDSKLEICLLLQHFNSVKDGLHDLGDNSFCVASHCVTCSHSVRLPRSSLKRETTPQGVQWPTDTAYRSLFSGSKTVIKAKSGIEFPTELSTLNSLQCQSNICITKLHCSHNTYVTRDMSKFQERKKLHLSISQHCCIVAME
jgi:hypothetical protein